MKLSTKYHPSVESQFEPGSRNRVLKNKLGIVSKKEMDAIESRAYIEAERSLLREFSQDHVFTSNDVLQINRTFLGKIYEWAGTLRSVNISKGDFMFAASKHLPKLMKSFEEQCLTVNTPCNGKVEEIAQKIATVHCELLLLHPFREGNGRTARILAQLMAYQGGLAGIDLGFIGKKGKYFNLYIKAVQDSTGSDYGLMTDIIFRGLRRALKT